MMVRSQNGSNPLPSCGFNPGGPILRPETRTRESFVGVLSTVSGAADQ